MPSLAELKLLVSEGGKAFLPEKGFRSRRSFRSRNQSLMPKNAEIGTSHANNKKETFYFKAQAGKGVAKGMERG